jgi:hypothetical protein
MSQNETQLWLSLKRVGDLDCQVIQFVQAHAVGLGFVRDQRAAQLEKDQFLHVFVLPQTGLLS